MSNKQLLREWFQVEYNPTLLKEDREKNGGKLFLSGIIQKANTKNQNKRIYPRRILQREVENYGRAVRENRAVGELDHPESSTVSLDRVSHVIREMSWEGDNVMGRVEVLNTPKGQILQSLLDSGITIGISSRGVGSTEKTNEGLDMVQEDYQLICFDIVSEPSTPGAYLGLSEGRQTVFEGVRYSKADRIYRAINDILVR
jgi:hypothetical protein